MNADFLQFHIEALTESLAFVGTPITYKGNSYSAVVSPIELSNDLVEGGLLEVLASNVVVLKSLFPVAPKAGELISLGNQEARIQKVESDDVSYMLMCITSRR